jgi:hypothetical protein
MNIFVGTAGFSYKDWEGVVYPPDLKRRKIHPLEYLAQFMDCCEINTSFYGHIRSNVGKDWCRKGHLFSPDERSVGHPARRSTLGGVFSGQCCLVTLRLSGGTIPFMRRYSTSWP